MTDETDTPPLDRQQLTDARLDRLERYTRDLGVWALGERARIWFPPLDDDGSSDSPSVPQLAAMSRAEARQDAMREIAMGANLSDKTRRDAEAAFLENAVASAIARILCASGALKHTDDPESPWAVGPCLLAAKAALVVVGAQPATSDHPAGKRRASDETDDGQGPSVAEESWGVTLRKAAVIGLIWGFPLVAWCAAWTRLGEALGLSAADAQLLPIYALMLFLPLALVLYDRAKRWRIIRRRRPLGRVFGQADEGHDQ